MRPDPDTCTDPDLLASEVRRLQSVIDSGETTLTDAERQAMEAAIGWIESPGVGDDAMPEDYLPITATLRALLERTKTVEK